MTLSDFLLEIRGHAELQAAIASGAHSKALADIERWFRLMENSDNSLAIATHDELVRIVSRNAPLKERLFAVHAAGSAAISRALAGLPKPAPTPQLQ
jgi:hypothetical protein